MQDFINNIVIEGVVVEPPSQIRTKSSGILLSVVVWHTINGVEMLFRAVSNSNAMKSFFKDLDRGHLVTFYGKALFLKRKENPQPFIIVSADSLRVLDVGLEYGTGLLENADLTAVNELKTLTLPWEVTD